MAEDKSKLTLQNALTAFLGIAVVILGGVNITEDKVYYCEDRAIALACDRLSSTAKTCYSTDESLTNKRCNSGWKQFDTSTLVEPSSTVISGNDGEFSTNGNGKEYTCLATNGRIDKFTKCTSSTGDVYLGNIIN